MNSFKTLCALLCCASAISCSNHDTVMTPYEKALALDNATSRSFHSMIYFPSGTSLHFPGYIVAIEKSPQAIVGGPKFDKQARFVKSGSYLHNEKRSPLDTRNQIFWFQQLNAKAMFIWHIIRNNFTVIPGDSNTPYISNSHCFVYNAYVDKSLVKKSASDLTKISDWHACDIATDINDSSSHPPSFYQDGIPALTALKNNLAQDINSGSYTHILLMVMGWNTSQNEAIRNFNDIAGNIMVASLEPGSQPQKVVIDRASAIKSVEKNSRRSGRSSSESPGLPTGQP